MWLLAIAVLAVTASEGDTLDRVRVHAASGTTTLSITVSSSLPFTHTATVDFEVPHGARVVAMSVKIGRERADAKPIETVAARATFRELTQRAIDPALLELVESTAERDRLRLHVFPISKTSRARVEIVIERVTDTSRIGVSAETALLASGHVARPLVITQRAPEPLWCGFGRH
jgi:hypothetical protein